MPTFLTLGRPPSEDGRPLLDGLLVAAAGVVGELDAGMADDEASDALAFLVHSGRPFTATAGDGVQVVRILAATVAALRGDDVRVAWTAPDVARVIAVPDPAARALREVLAHVGVPDVVRVGVELAGLGLSRSR